jgi:hypothetical protein
VRDQPGVAQPIARAIEVRAEERGRQEAERAAPERHEEDADR